MPSEYEALVAALTESEYPFAEYGWQTRPEGAYGVVSLDMENGHEDGDGEKLDRTWECSIDLFWPMLADRRAAIGAIEAILTAVVGNAWDLNSLQYERETKLFHAEWVCTVADEPEETTETETDDGTETAGTETNGTETEPGTESETEPEAGEG